MDKLDVLTAEIIRHDQSDDLIGWVLLCNVKS